MDVIKVSEMLVENLEGIRLYVLLYVKDTYKYAWVTTHICYGNTCNCFGFRGCKLSTERMVARSPPFSLFPRFESVGHYQL